MKIEFVTIFGKVAAKNRAFGNNIIFLQQFFPWGGERSLFPPGGAYVLTLFFCETSITLRKNLWNADPESSYGLPPSWRG